MKLTRILITAFIAFAPTLAFAQSSIPTEVRTQMVQASSPQAAGTPIGVPVAVVQQPAAPQKITIAGGDLAAELINWLALVFGAPVAGFVVMWARALAKKAGVDMSDAMGAKLDDMLQRGITQAAAKAGHDLQGTLQVDVQNKLLQEAVQYAQAHGANTINDLAAGNSLLAPLKQVDPNDPQVQAALRARATALLDKMTPNTILNVGGNPAQAASSPTTGQS
jgi:hypothetical protein